MDDHATLLGRFADHGDQAAFAEIVRQKVDLVYAAALRQVGGDAHLAQDVTQAVFLALASEAGRLKRHPMLAGWLYTTTRFLALKAVRTQARWQRREQEANTMSLTSRSLEPAWNDLRPVIDEAMHRLGEKDRAALLLRFFEGKSLADVGVELGLAENAARMRVDRALEKLRTALARRGITSAAAALGTALSAQPAVAAPAGLVASLTTGGFFAAVAVGSGGVMAVASGLGCFMGANKIILGATGLLAAIGLGAFLGVQFQPAFPPRAAETRAAVGGADLDALRNLRAENLRLNAELARRTDRASSAVSTAASTAALTAVDQLRVLADLSKRRLLTPMVRTFSYKEAGALSPAFAELFALTPPERAALQSAVDRARERMASLELENAAVERATNGDVVITMRPFPQAGGAVYDEMIKAFAETLGPDRQSAFLTLAAKEVEKSLGWFGTAERALTFSQAATPSGETQFNVQAQHKLPTESGSQSSSFKTFDEMAAAVGTPARLLPKDFGSRK